MPNFEQEELVYYDEGFLRCPFCNGPAVAYASGSYIPEGSTNVRYLYDVKCSKCGMGYTEGSLPLEKVFALWNTRYDKE